MLSLLALDCDGRATIGHQVPAMAHTTTHQGPPSSQAVSTGNQNQNSNKNQAPRTPISATFTTTINKNQEQKQQQPSTVINHHKSARHHHIAHPTHQFNPEPNVRLPNSQYSYYQRVPSFSHNSLCHLPEHLLPDTKCTPELDSEFKRSAIAEFQAKLSETSLDLSQFLSSYLEEFKSSSLDLVLVANNNTLSRLQQQQQQQKITFTSSPTANQELNYDFNQQYEATKRLYESIYNHLADYDTSAASGSPASVAHLELSNGPLSDNHNVDRSSYSPIASNSVADINREINDYFRRLYLIQVKKLLDQKLTGSSVEVSLECLGANLHSQHQVEEILNELNSPLDAHVSLEQSKLSKTIKQSLEFARTLLSSLSLSNEIFRNLTSQASEWMPNQSCHQALARMTICPQCYSSAALRSKSGAGFINDHILIAQPTCENYCLNVVRGCMNDIYELNRFWSDHINALTRFKTNMIQMNNIENVMSSLDEKLVNFMTKLNQQYSNNISSTSGIAVGTTINEQQRQAFESSVSGKVSWRVYLYTCICEM